MSLRDGTGRALTAREFRAGQWRPLSLPGSPSPPAVPDRAVLGMYLGNPGEYRDLRFAAMAGHPPQLLTSYYQADNGGGESDIKVEAEIESLERGTDLLITITTAGGPWNHAQVASGAADAWIDRIAAQVVQICVAAVSLGRKVKFTFDHEFEVKRNQGKFAWSPTDQEYADAFTRFTGRVRQACLDAGTVPPTILYWWGYARPTEIDSIGAKITAQRPPDELAFDPYVYPHHSATTTLEQMVHGSMSQGKLDWLLVRSWYQGQPIGLAEFAKDAVHGDAQCASFLTDLRPRFDALGIAFAVYFGRDKTDDIQADPTPAAAYAATGVWPGITRTSSFSKGDGSMYSSNMPAAYAALMASFAPPA